jgi:hypothetical protein
MLSRPRLIASLAILNLLVISGCNESNEQVQNPQPAIENNETSFNANDSDLITVTDCTLELAGPNQGGELANHYIYRASSPNDDTNPLDITAEAEPLLEAASVPDGAIDADGNLWMYFVHGDAEKHGIWVAKGTPDGEVEIQSCVTIDGSFNPRGVDPDIVIDQDGNFVLTFYANFPFGPYTPGPEDGPHVSEFYQAVSTDGIHFETRSQLFERENATDPSAIQLKDGSWLVAWPEHPSIHFMSSSDGLEWTKLETTVEFPNGAGIPEIMLLENGDIRLVVGGKSLYSYRSSDNGITWNEEALEVEASSHSQTNHPSFTSYREKWLILLNNKSE